MKHMLKMGLAVVLASGLSLTAGSAGAVYDQAGYQRCLRAGQSECFNLYGFDPDNGDAWAQCIETFNANCRAYYGVPDPNGDPCEKGAPNPEECPIID
ncbi:hypothetical protein [Brevundimonas sp.]|uniref:hypothetical protein n=1 Tax=Brevundimonas sp. TaxID=1871086 RepID=UPI003F6E7CED